MLVLPFIYFGLFDTGSPADAHWPPADASCVAVSGPSGVDSGRPGDPFFESLKRFYTGQDGSTSRFPVRSRATRDTSKAAAFSQLRMTFRPTQAALHGCC